MASLATDCRANPIHCLIVLAMITYALPALQPGRPERGTPMGYWAFWTQLTGMFGMTLSFATAGIGQVYLERIMGLGYLDAQLKIQVHFLMLVATGGLFALGVALFAIDFFRYAPRFLVDVRPAPDDSIAPARAATAARTTHA